MFDVVNSLKDYLVMYIGPQATDFTTDIPAK
jgi:hypothetical protein